MKSANKGWLLLQACLLILAIASINACDAEGAKDHLTIHQGLSGVQFISVGDDDQVLYISLDDANNVWLATATDTVFHLSLESKNIQPIGFPEEYSIAAMAADPSWVYVGTTTNGMWIYKKASKQWERLQPSSGELPGWVSAIFPEPEYLWIGGASLYQFNRKTGAVTRFEDPKIETSSITQIIRVDESSLYIAGPKGVHRFYENTRTFENIIPKCVFQDPEIPKLCQDSSIPRSQIFPFQGGFWAMAECDPPADSTGDSPSGSAQASVTMIAKWSGLMKLEWSDQTKSCQLFPLRGGRYALLAKEDKLFIGSHKGVLRFHPEQQTYRQISFGIPQADEDQEVTALADTGGYLIAGVEEGVWVVPWHLLLEGD